MREVSVHCLHVNMIFCTFAFPPFSAVLHALVSAPDVLPVNSTLLVVIYNINNIKLRAHFLSLYSLLLFEFLLFSPSLGLHIFLSLLLQINKYQHKLCMQFACGGSYTDLSAYATKSCIQLLLFFLFLYRFLAIFFTKTSSTYMLRYITCL